jgi:hypothetical protein
MSRILVPDFINPSLSNLSFQEETRNVDFKKISDYNKEREDFSDAATRGMVPFNSKDLEDFPHKHVLTGIQEVNRFNRIFFSKENLDWIHSNIRMLVHEKSTDKSIISRQKDSEVLEAMRRLYLQYSNNPDTVPEMKKEISRLNDLVLKDTVPRILSEIAQYKKYLQDIDKIRTPVKLPINTSVIGTKLYNRGPADVLGIFV